MRTALKILIQYNLQNDKPWIDVMERVKNTSSHEFASVVGAYNTTHFHQLFDILRNQDDEPVEELLQHIARFTS